MSNDSKTRIQTTLPNDLTIWHLTDRHEPTLGIQLNESEIQQLREVGLLWRVLEISPETIEAAHLSMAGVSNRHRKIRIAGAVVHLDYTVILNGDNVNIVIAVKNPATSKAANLRLDIPAHTLERVGGQSAAQQLMLQVQPMVTYMHGSCDPELQALYKGLKDKIAETHTRLVEYDRAKAATPNATDAKSEEESARGAPTPQQGKKKLAPPTNPQGGNGKVRGGAKLAPPTNPQRGNGKSVDKKPTKPAVDTTPRTLPEQLAAMAAKLPQEPKAPPVEPPVATKGTPAAPEQVVTQTEEATVAPVTPES